MILNLFKKLTLLSLFILIATMASTNGCRFDDDDGAISFDAEDVQPGDDQGDGGDLDENGSDTSGGSGDCTPLFASTSGMFSCTDSTTSVLGLTDAGGAIIGIGGVSAIASAGIDGFTQSGCLLEFNSTSGDPDIDAATATIDAGSQQASGFNLTLNIAGLSLNMACTKEASF